MQNPTSARALPKFAPSLCAAPVKAGAPPEEVFVGEPTGVGEIKNDVAVPVDAAPLFISARYPKVNFHDLGTRTQERD